MARSIRILILLVASLGLIPVAAWASGGEPVRPTPPSAPPKSPEERAVEHYNQGLGFRDQAWRIEDKLAGESPDQAERLKGKVRKAYQSAIREFEAAVEQNPRFHQAYSDLGYTRRKTGDYQAALEAYDRALELAPDYTPAIEYRAEAQLGLNRVEAAQAAYSILLNKDRERAGELLAAMRSWVAQRRATPAGVDPATVDALERWIGEQGDGSGGGSPAASRKSRVW